MCISQHVPQGRITHRTPVRDHPNLNDVGQQSWRFVGFFLGCFMSDIFKNSDSIAAKFSKSSNRHGRASTTYKVRMQTTYKNLELHAKLARWGKDVSPVNITEKQLRGYVAARIDAKISARTIQNEISHIRRSLEAVGRGEFAQVTCANEKIGVPAASRIGTGKIVDEAIFSRARENLAPNSRALLDLQRNMGLRIKEVVCSGPSLKEWSKALENGNHVLTIRFGTKGGRLRDLYVRPDNVELVKSAVADCLAVLQKQKKLVDSPNLRAALETHTDRLGRVGISDDNSSHSLRRAFALDQYRFYQNEGYDDKKALGLTSRDLGHGDGRGRWIYNNYIRTSLETE